MTNTDAQEITSLDSLEQSLLNDFQQGFPLTPTPFADMAEQLGVSEEQVTPEASFVDDLGADSLDTVELVMALEEEFNTEIPDEDAEKITTVKQAIEFIEAHASG